MTTSGKTYTALQRLKEAKSGVYCGPLRLLAVQCFEELNMQGVPTNLITGQVHGVQSVYRCCLSVAR